MRTLSELQAEYTERMAYLQRINYNVSCKTAHQWHLWQLASNRLAHRIIRMQSK